MKFRHLALLTTASIVAVGVAIAVGATVNKQFASLAPTKADDVRSVTITADQIGAAIGAGHSGTFEVDGLTWSVNNASYEAGVATINEGVLQNTTAAGQSVSPISGKQGNGFTKLIIHDKTSKSGLNLTTQNADGSKIADHGIGAESQALYAFDFSGDNTAAHKVFRVALTFGAGGGTSFTSIEFQYTCVVPTPSMTMTAPKSSEQVGETIQLVWNFEFVGGTTPEVTFVSSDTDVATVSEHGGLVTGLSAGTTTISASFEYADETYYSNSVELEFVSAISYKSISFFHEEGKNSRVEGAGLMIYIDNSEIGLQNGEKDKVAIHLDFDGGTNYKGYEAALTKDYTAIDVTAAGYIYFTVPNGFPNDGDFTHTVTLVITKSLTEIYEGKIVFVGNAYSSQSGTWH